MFIAQNSINTSAGAGAVRTGQVSGFLLIGNKVTAAGNIKNLYIYSSDPTPGTYTVTLRKNGAASALTAQIASGDLSAADITHTVAVIVGDVIDYTVVAAGGAPDAAVNVSVECDL